jgi:hypothetical protein
MTGHYFGPDGEPIGMWDWCRLMRDEASHRVALTELPGGVEVSTVWLGLDHNFGAGPPLIYESMVFGGPLDHVQQRYPNRVAALAGHDQLVAAARDAAVGAPR